MLTSMTPGSGATRMTLSRGSWRRRIALDVDRQAASPVRRGLGGGDQLEIVLDALDRRHEHAEPPVARLDREGGADRAAGLAELLLDPLLLRRVAGGEMRHRLGAAGLDRLRRLGRRLRRARGSRAAARAAPSDRRCWYRDSPTAPTWGSLPSGSRKPTGLSPGTR